MQYKKQVALALLCFTTQGHGNDVYSHTFFTAIPQQKLITNLTENLLVDQAHENGRALKRRVVQVALFGGKSTHQRGLRDYFLYGGNDGLRVRETPDLQGGTANNMVGNSQELIASDFNIQTLNGAFASTINVNPQQTVAGAAISLRVPVLDRMWASLEIPVVHVRNNLDLTESFTSTPLPAIAGGAVGFISPITGTFTVPVANMVNAFKQQGMLYGKIDGVQSRTRVADMSLKLGYDFVDHTDFYLSGYAGFVFPTGNRPQAEYMFEAIVGNNQHFGINGGMYGQVSFENFGHNNFWVGWSMEGEYLIRNTQRRSFDLKNRPWSRYLQVFPTEGARQSEIAAAAVFGGAIVTPFRTWGINYFTQDVKVHAGYNGSFDFNINYVGDAWHTTLGLNTYVRQAEEVTLKNAWNNQSVQVAGLPIYDKAAYGAATTIAGAIDTLREIGVAGQPAEMFIGDGTLAGAVPVYVQESDLDLGSAAHPAVYSQTVYSTVGYYRTSDHYPQNFELGSSYEFGSDNTTLHRWTIWTKIQITF